MYFNFSVSPYVFRQEFLCFFDLFFQNMSYEREQKWLQQLAGEILSDSEVEEAEDKSDNGEQDLIEERMIQKLSRSLNMGHLNKTILKEH